MFFFLSLRRSNAPNKEPVKVKPISSKNMGKNIATSLEMGKRKLIIGLEFSISKMGRSDQTT